MKNTIPNEVLAHILEVQAENEPVPPPKNAFTAQQYYDILVKKLEESGVPEDKFPKYHTVREKLKKDQTLNQTQYPGNGPFYFWRDEGAEKPVKKED